jgi:hypothetical protein
MGATQSPFNAVKTRLFSKTLKPDNFFHFKPGLTIQAAVWVLILCGASYAGAQSCSGMSLGTNASLNGFVPFPATNVWNTNIASAPVDPNSAAITGGPGFWGLYLHPDFGSESDFGIPYVVVDSTTTPAVPINVIDYADQSDMVVTPLPATAPIEGNPVDCSGWPDTYNGDTHVLVLDRAKCALYETFNTNRCNGMYNASSETLWDLKNYETRPSGWTSADAAGLPIFPGLVRYDEIASGAIHHALRFTLQQTKNDANGGYFVYPATHAAGNVWGSKNVMGMRIRLKASFDISGFSPVNQIILTAMKQYGMILADNGGYFFFQGVPDPRFDDNDLDNLKTVASSNFEVVQMNPVFPGYDSETAPTGALPVIGSFTASATTVGSGAPVTFNYSASQDSYDYIDKIGPVAAGSGNVTINPTATQTYILNSTNAFGRTASTPITVTVSSAALAPPVFSLAAGSYTAAQTVGLSAANTGAAIYYTTNGSTPTTGSTSYSGAIQVSSTETIQAIAVASGYVNSPVASATYTIALPVTATPAFSIRPGSYPLSQLVTLSDATSGAAIYYTIDGSTPTSNSKKYARVLTLSASETIKAIAIASGYTTSAVASATYTVINPPAVQTASASAVSEAGATLNAVVNSNGLAGSFVFLYGTSSTSLTKMTAVTALAASNNSIAASIQVTGLKSKTTYYYQAVATTDSGMSRGTILSFTTN